jgi:hypothetical protein
VYHREHPLGEEDHGVDGPVAKHRQQKRSAENPYQRASHAIEEEKDEMLSNATG